MPKILVTAKTTPDIDGTACLLAYAHLLKIQGQDAEGIAFGNIQPETMYFMEKHGVVLRSEPDGGISRWDSYVLVDASSMKGMPKVVSADKVIEIIDHREGRPEIEFPNAKVQNELVGAAATIVVEQYIQANQKPLLEHAKLLYGAIHHNSLNFLSSNTSPRDKDAVEFLEKEFGLSKQIIEEMFLYATDWIGQHVEQALRDDAKEYDLGFPVQVYQLVVYGRTILNKKQEIRLAIAELSKQAKVDWSFLNLVDLESKTSSLYCDSAKGQEILGRALGCVFSENWANLDKTVLRKQIMPALQRAVNLNRT